MSKHQAIHNPENVCFNCLKEKNETELNKIHIPAMGYGSRFDNFSTRIHLCNDCMKLTNPEWWKLDTVQCEWDKEDNHGFFKYKFEEEIFNFVKQMPIEGQELFYARYGYGACTGYMSDQDWIDYKLGILPHEKCKEYGYYSPQEKQAYEDRFPNCKHVELKVYGDGSKHTKCFLDAFGDENGNCGLNISDECYLCDSFEERDGEIKVVDVLEEYYKRETQRLLNMIEYANKRLEKIKNKTLSEND